MRKFNNGFTLAEVLITLLIIGVISSIVIPGLINNTQKAEYQTAWAKAFSDISNAHKMIKIDNSIPYSSYPLFFPDIEKHLSYTKKCTNASSEGCWHKINEWKTFGDIKVNQTMDYNGYILNNGMLIGFSPMSYYLYASSPLIGTDIGMLAFIDVNGFKKPNKVGVDIFAVEILGNRVVCEGSPNSLYDLATNSGQYCDKNNTQTFKEFGAGCSLKALMKQDY